MAVTFKNDKKDEIKAASAIDSKADTVVDAKEQSGDDSAITVLKKQLSDAEDRAKSEREQRIAAENATVEANTKAVSSENTAIKAQKTAIENAVQVATGNVSTIKKELHEAMEAGDLAKQVDLQEKLADARWTLNNSTQTQKQFTVWEEQQKNAPKQTEQKPQYTRTEQAWIDAHPRFNTDDDYYGVVAGADAAARRKGIKPDTTAYYEYVESALTKSGLENNAAEDNGRDTTGAMEQEDEQEEQVVATKKPKLVVPAAPASNSSPTSSSRKSQQSFKLTPEMRDMAHRTFGPNSSHKLSEKEAEEKYAARQLEIRDRRANGEKI